MTILLHLKYFATQKAIVVAKSAASEARLEDFWWRRYLVLRSSGEKNGHYSELDFCISAV